ncbi:MAG: metallophosphoesterase [Candidatus Methylomirabilales bacterium]
MVMVIVALADIHDDLGRLSAISEDVSAADVVLLVGDLTNFGRQSAAARVVGAVRKYNDHVYAVPGNCDYPEVDAYLTREGINLHRGCTVIGGIAFLGVGGSLPCPAKTPNEFSEKDFEHFLAETAFSLSPDAPVILVSHQPPRDTVTDLARIGGHVGSQSVRAFISKVQPILCFTAHIHEGRGMDFIGRTKVVNPGPLWKGGYAYATVRLGVSEVEIRT